VRADGDLWAWGWGAYGRLGTNMNSTGAPSINVPALVGGFLDRGSVGDGGLAMLSAEMGW
jgi:hypothetical protein